MKLKSKTNFGAICVVLTLASTQVSALTLGRLHGGALLGKELDVSVLVQFAPEDDVSAACFTADVAYGENPLERSRITVQSQPGSQPNSQVIRVTSGARVDEAVVTVNLMATCAPKASRRYVMLADVLSETASATPAVTTPVASTSVAVTSRAAIQSNAAAPARGLEAKVRAKAPTASAKVAAGNVAAKSVVSGKAEHDAAAKALSQANSAALEDLQHRVDDISKWQATSNTAEELLKSESREKALEADLKGLHQVTAKNQQNIQTLSAAMEKAESENYGSLLVYGLGALLAACLGFLAFVLMRLRRGGPDALPWWSAADGRAGEPAHLQEAPTDKVEHLAHASAKSVAAPAAVAPSVPVPVDKKQEVVTVAAPVLPDVDIALHDVGVGGNSLPTIPTPVSAISVNALTTDDIPNAYASLKAINTKDMLDVRQQAEFFMALGQHDDAVKLLQTSIQASEDANPLIYLDLLKIFHTLSRRTEFEQYRTEFNQQFTGRIPDYSHFLMEGNGLEAYDDICQQIVVLWPTDYTVDFIEQCLIRTPEDDPEQGIDLEAFKDLLLLYGVLKRLDQTPDSVVLPFSAARVAVSQVAPLPSAATPTDIEIDTPLPVVPATAVEAAADLDLDLDLHLDLDLDIDREPEKPSVLDNLINFDVSSFEPPKAGK